MKLLFVTQKIDKNDDLLGVYHEWVKCLAEKAEKIFVVCLYKGEYDLPKNVQVFSLGKESGRSKIEYLKNFYKYVWNLKNDYDTVFVHMNTEYLILAGWLWKFWGKRIVLWYAHYQSNLKLRLAVPFADAIVTSVKKAFPFESKKLLVLQQGIDTELFKQQGIYKKESAFKILFLGRISPVKDLETLLKAAKVLKERNFNFRLSIVGSPTDADSEYYKNVRNLSEELGLNSRISWSERVPNRETVRIYDEHDVFVNLTTTGSFDKVILEAMSCELPVLVCNRAYEEIFPSGLTSFLIFEEKNANDLADKIIAVATLPPQKLYDLKKMLRRIVVESHNLDNLISKLADVLQGKN